MNDITSRFNTIIMEIINSINENSIILDAEAIAISNIGKSLPFQNILQKPKLYCENNIKYNHDIKINIFDILYLNNNCLLDVKLDDRKKILDNCNIKNSKYIEICKSLKIDSINLVKSINKLLSISINCGHEGLVIKDSNSKYISGRKGKLWIKKKQLMDTLDLVITGGVWGVGKRKNKIGSYILSCYHKKTNNFTEVCNVGTGLNDNMLEYLTNELLKIVISEKETTIKVIPKIIVEVGFEEIQKRNNSCEENYSLRFPRVIKIRNDKNIEDIDTLEKIEYMYLNQK